jgi:hypothetical protein
MWPGARLEHSASAWRHMNDSSNVPEQPNPQPIETDTPVDQDRRDALAKLGRYAAYTAPLMLGMMTSVKAHSASGQAPD